MISFKRTVDKLGRLVIPKELREQYGFGENTPVEITPVTKNMLTIKLMNNSCLFCKNENDLVEFHDHYVCRNCIKQMKKGIEGVLPSIFVYISCILVLLAL